MFFLVVKTNSWKYPTPTVVKGALYTDVDHCMDILAKESREPPTIATNISNGFAIGMNLNVEK